jgi:hypothetical protein
LGCNTTNNKKKSKSGQTQAGQINFRLSAFIHCRIYETGKKTEIFMPGCIEKGMRVPEKYQGFWKWKTKRIRKNVFSLLSKKV